MTATGVRAPRRVHLQDLPRQSVTIRTVRDDDTYTEGGRIQQRVIRNIVSYPEVTVPPVGLHLQTGTIRFMGKTVRVMRWTQEPNEDGGVLSTPWVTNGVLYKGQFLSVDDLDFGHGDEEEAGSE